MNRPLVAGKTREDGNGTRVRWCDIGATHDDQSAGVTILLHPQNPRHPEPVRLHLSMPYMCFAECHLGDWQLEPGQHHVLRYRYVVHDGPVQKEESDRL